MSDESQPGSARNSMPIAHRSSSEAAGRQPRPDARALLRRHGVVTSLLTMLLAAVFGLGVAFGRVTVRGGRAGQREMPIVDVWRAFLDNLPAQAPGILNRGVLLVLLALAVVAAAYVLVATLRLPREETDGGAGTDGTRTPEA